MHIAIDLTALLPEPKGVDVACMEIVHQLGRIDSANRYTLLINTADRPRFPRGSVGANMTLRPSSVRSRLVRGLFQQAILPMQLSGGAFDVLHSPSFLMPLWRGRARHLLTIHDLTFFSMPEVHNRLHSSVPFRMLVSASIRRADLINVPSEVVRSDLLDRFPEVPGDRVRVTPWGISPRFCPGSREEVASNVERLRLPSPYILFVGTIEPRKNLMSLVEAFRRLDGAGLHLVLAGSKGWNVDPLYRMANSAGLRGRVHFTGYVPEDDLLWIYRGASVFVYPSRSEGFGFPPLEAMACGVPVIFSPGSSLEENMRGAADMVSPSDPAAMARMLSRLLNDTGHRDRMMQLGLERAKAFRWERTGQLVLDCYRDLAVKRP